jgi:uncharacterized protein YndB with AHSA1/START domain
MRAVTRLALWLAALLVALGAAVAAGGALLPRAHQVSSEVVIARPRDEVWPVVRDLGSLARWWPDVDASSRVGHASGAERWRQVFNGMELTIEIVDDRPPHRLVTRIVAPEGAMTGGMWIYELRAEDGATRVRLTEDGWVAPWPLRTIVWLSGYEASIDSYLTSLARHFGQHATPLHQGAPPPPSSPQPETGPNPESAPVR